MRRALLALLLALVALPLVPALPTGALPLDPATFGRWGEPFELPTQGEDAVLLPTGKVLLFEGGSDAILWDSTTGSVERVPAPEGINCAGLALLPDGRVLVNGGHNETFWYGSAQTLLFDPWTETWAKLPDMPRGAYYPGTIQLADGRALTLDGNDDAGLAPTTAGIWDGEAWTSIAQPQPMEFYPRMHVVPGGDIIIVGQQPESYRFDVGAQAWSTGASSAGGMRWGGVSALLPDLSTVLVAGGGSMGFSSEGWGSHPAPFRDMPERVVKNLAAGREPATASVELFDFATLTFRDAAPMHVARRDLTSVLLPGGEPLVVGGAYGFEPIPGWVEHALAPEVYDASADAWTLLAPSNRHRGYHSTAILLPDGRVLASGGDFETGVGALTGLESTGELFSPPYLFRGARPTIASAETEWPYDATMPVRTPDAANVAAVHLVRLSSVTHSLNTDQRVVPLDFDRTGGEILVARVPDDPGAAPPGWYMLFLVSDDGVPSVAKFVHLA